MDELRLLKNKFNSASWDNLSISNVSDIVELTNSVLAGCSLNNKLKSEIRFKKPRYQSQLEAIQNKKNYISNTLYQITHNNFSAKSLRENVQESMDLYDSVIELIFEVQNRVVGQID